MKSDVVENIREVGANVEAIGRMLQTRRKRGLTKSEYQTLTEALQLSTSALSKFQNMIPLQ